MTKYRFAHIHGFSSSGASAKGLHLRSAYKEFGQELILPDLNRPSFEKLTFTSALEVLDEMDHTTPGDAPWRISASSMGGYLTALWAQRHPEKVDRLVLLCPAFELMDRFHELVGADNMKLWEDQNYLLLPGPDDKDKAVHWDFIQDGRAYPAVPEVPCPTVLIHGRQDPTIPILSSRRYAARRDHIRLIEVDDEHSLMNSLAVVTQTIVDFFELSE